MSYELCEDAGLRYCVDFEAEVAEDEGRVPADGLLTLELPADRLVVLPILMPPRVVPPELLTALLAGVTVRPELVKDFSVCVRRP